MQHIQPFVHNDSKLAREIARIAVRSLYFEIKAYPKPGLVSFIDHGAHADMSGKTFYDSLFTLRHYFFRVVYAALQGASFEELKHLSIAAEQRMLQRTKGINTHRGAIFSLGLFCISSAQLLKIKSIFSLEELHLKMIQDWRSILESHALNHNSHSHQVLTTYRDKSILDAKQIAMAGYPIVFKILPSFIEHFEKSLLPEKLNRSCLYAYLHLILSIDDTNILYRKNWETLLQVREKAEKIHLLSCSHQQEQAAIHLHHEFSNAGISPGGVGDLIGVCLFLGQLMSEKIRCHRC